MAKKFNDTIEQDDIISTLNESRKCMEGVLLDSLNTIIDEMGDSIVMTSTVRFETLNLDNDKEFFKLIKTAVKEYIVIISPLIKRIEDELPDMMTTDTTNINARIMFGLVSEVIFFSVELVPLLSDIMVQYFSEDTLRDTHKRDFFSKLTLMINTLPNVNEKSLTQVVEVIGQIGALKQPRGRGETIPLTTLTGFINTNFTSLTDEASNLVNSFIHSIGISDSDKPYGIVMNSFVGNPIMYIRFFIIDMKAMRLNKHRDDLKVLELRLLELQNNPDGLSSTDIRKVIKEYENSIEKTKLKIDKLSKVR